MPPGVWSLSKKQITQCKAQILLEVALFSRLAEVLAALGFSCFVIIGADLQPRSICSFFLAAGVGRHALFFTKGQAENILLCILFALIEFRRCILNTGIIFILLSVVAVNMGLVACAYAEIMP
jgi:hypothetical protein